MSDESLLELASTDKAMSSRDLKQIELEKKAKELFGMRGFSLANGIFLDHPGLDEKEFWRLFEARINGH